ncbi:TENA_THI-4 domain-containing protein [Cephalotus follicularis]|uniref:aminopyrimidine aminohydrolase n=1 Tax=Cephalotus follicularis TaxID=3775 RepID=A0A1Q3BSA9_CEPFO|nr:TENA_THI-4 domain-containing protein [Cephalotus follicularis]
MEEKRQGEVGIIDKWLKKHLLMYMAATRHPMILSIRDGSINISCFKTWLGQDYLFVRALVPFVASVLIKAWNDSDDSNTDVEVILSGLASLKDEISWFQNEASNWGVQLSHIVAHKATGDYCRFLESLMLPEVEFTISITAYWAIEVVYQDAFTHCLEDDAKTPPELQETCQRWGNDEFGQYCQSLKKIANRRLEKCSDDLLVKAEATFLRVLEHEVQFWNMSAMVEPEDLASK